MRRWVEVAQFWGPATALGVAAALVIWSAWYFTKVPCLPDNAVQGLCNPGMLARFINAEILALAGGGGIAVGALKGGYDNYMLKTIMNQEREARLQSEQQLRDMIAELHKELQEERQQAAAERRQAEAERRQAEAERRQADEEWRQTEAEWRRYWEEERRRAGEDRRLAIEDRAQSIAIQQAMLDTIVRLAEGRNGNDNRPAD